MFADRAYQWITAISASVLMTCASAQAESSRQIITVRQSPTSASLRAIGPDGTMQFHIEGEDRRIEPANFIRWSNPVIDLQKSVVVLLDGSRLIVAQSWTSRSSLQIEKDMGTFSTKLFGKVSIPRNQIRGVLLNPPSSLRRRSQLLDKLKSFSGEDDRLLLTNGDVLLGKFVKMESAPSAKSKREVIQFEMAGTIIAISEDRVSAWVFANPQPKMHKHQLAVGLRDGSYLMTTKLHAGPDDYHATLPSGIQLHGTDLTDIVSLQSTGITYLSDLEATEYQHQPYLNIPCPYRQNKNLQGGPLHVDGLIYSKGLAMHSKSQLTYDIPEAEYKHFAASLAIDDLSDGGGSVIFKVLLHRDSNWQIAFTSPIVRGGDQPLAVKVDLHSARQIALVVEYADRGDELDHANWLDARFE